VPLSLTASLNDLAGGLFLLTAFGLVVPWQAQQCLTLFVLQSVLLAGSALLLGFSLGSPHLLAVGLLTLGVKALLMPWLLRRTVGEEIYTRRELSPAVNVPSSLLIALALAAASYFMVSPLLTGASGPFTRDNLPIGLAGLLVGAYTLLVRREAIPQLIGILAMENGAFFAGVSVAPDLPMIAELAAAFDVLVIVLVMGILTRAIHEHVGVTDVASLTALRELRVAPEGDAGKEPVAP
jgi:hydrogenase-4 component E